jgi:hypothetical protein
MELIVSAEPGVKELRPQKFEISWDLKCKTKMPS